MKRLLFVCILTVPTTLLAQTATPTESPTSTPQITPSPSATATSAPSGTPTPTACQMVQSCVDSQLSGVVSSCVAANPSCSAPNSDKFAVAAGVLAQRAIEYRKCTDSKALKNRNKCRGCYESAKAPLRKRFKGDLFKGLLAQAVSVIQEKKIAVCDGLSGGGKK